MKRNAILFVMMFFMALLPVRAQTPDQGGSSAPKKAVASQAEDKLPWWPTDAKPAPVRDEQKGGFWWWPDSPGTSKDLWGNRGYAYVNKIIYDWHGGGSGGGSVKDVQVKISDVGFVDTADKPSLLIKRMIRKQKLQFKDKAVELNPEHAAILKKAAESLKRNKDANILVAAYNDTPDLGRARIEAVEKFLVDQGVLQERINILAFEKLQESGLSAKQSLDSGTIQLIIAEVKEVVIPGAK